MKIYYSINSIQFTIKITEYSSGCMWKINKFLPNTYGVEGFVHHPRPEHEIRRRKGKLKWNAFQRGRSFYRCFAKGNSSYISRNSNII
jgi:hypothetical protein